MGKKSNKNGQNKAKPVNRPQQQPQPAVIIKSDAELSSEEKERLKKEGKDEKQELIQQGEEKKQELIDEGQDEKDKLIEKANKDAKKIIEDAKQEAEKAKEELQRQYKKEAIDEAEEEAKEKAKQILEEAEEIKKQAEAEREKLDEEKTSLEKEHNELAKKRKKLIKDSLDLDEKERSCKEDVLQEFCEKLSKLKEKNEQLADELENTKGELKVSNEDRDFYLSELDSSRVRKQELTQLEEKNKNLESQNATLDNLYKECKAERDEYFELISRFGDNPNALRDERNRLEKENEQLHDRLANTPSEDEIGRLHEVEKQFDIANAELRQLKKEKVETDKKLADLEIYESELENSQRIIRVLELQRLELQRELDRIEENYNSRQETVFSALSAIDNELVSAKNYPRTGRTLKQICEDFRNYMAARENNPLYYSPQSIRTFFAGLASSHILILQGMSGTGKSSLPKAFADYMGSVTDRIEVQSSWKDRNDLLGFYNDFEKRYKETKFLEALYSARRDSGNIHMIMLDEMNISRIEYYFADFLSVLEEEDNEKWKIRLVSRDVRGKMPEYVQNGELQIGENTWFIGTANKDDSTFTITDKVYDRAIVLDFNEREKEFSGSYTSPRGVGYDELKELLQKATKLTPEMKTRVEEMIEWLDYMMQKFEISFGNRISKQINMFVPAYVECGGEVEEAIDIIFATKVLRKLQGLYDESTKKRLQDFLDEIGKKYNDKLKITTKKINKMISRM